MDEGTAYGRRTGTSLMELAQVGPGTPYGEVLRRYWHPVALAGNATGTPTRLRVLGEDLILFRTGSGRVGLLTPRCAHRGASLFYGGVEQDGIRCCYHGWVFDTEGRCLEQPCEPDLGRHRDRVRQPWYPVREYHGMVFAYLGPPDRKPAFPVYDVLDDGLDEGEFVLADDRSFGGGGPAVLDFNWLQHWENVLDPFHVPILHARFSGNQFVPEMAILPECGFGFTPQGVRVSSTREFPDGRVLTRVTDCVFPNIRLVASPKLTAAGPARFVGWVVPHDDTHFTVFTLARADSPDYLIGERGRIAGKLWEDLTDAEHQRYPGDYEAQRSQGDITHHNQEFLTTTDQGVTMLRRMMGKQVGLVAKGADPVGVVLGTDTVAYRVEAGNYFSASAADTPETVIAPVR